MTEGNFMTVDSGRILVLANLFFIISLTRPWLKLLLGFHGKMLFEGKYVIPGGTTYYSEWNCKMDIYKGVIQETTRNMFLLCSSTLRRTILICSLNLKNLNEHVQYHFKMDTLQSEKEWLPGISWSKGSLLLSAHWWQILKVKFSWRGKLLQLTCLPNELSCALRLF